MDKHFLIDAVFGYFLLVYKTVRAIKYAVCRFSGRMSNTASPSNVPILPRMFFAGIVVKSPENKIAVQAKAPTCKGPGRFFDVLLGVVAASEGKQFHHLAGKIFIGAAFFVFAGC